MIYRLCGGTFFTLLCNARKAMPTHADMYNGVSSGLTETELLAALTRVADSDIDASAYSSNQGIKDAAGKYKKCTGYGGEFYRLGKPKIKGLLDSKVKHSYERALAGMSECVAQFLEVRTKAKKDEYLVKALVELLEQDNFIPDEQPLYVCEDGSTMTKAEICSAPSLCLQSFLLGIWHYVVTAVDNKVGADTFNVWCPSNNGGQREYLGTLGEDSTKEIKITYLGSMSSYDEMEEDAASEVLEEDTSSFVDNDPEVQDCSFAESRCVFQIINNPTIVYQNGEKNIHIDYVENLNL